MKKNLAQVSGSEHLSAACQRYSEAVTLSVIKQRLNNYSAADFLYATTINAIRVGTRHLHRELLYHAAAG